MMLTVLVVVTCLLLNATTLLILIVGVLIATVMMLLSTAVSLTMHKPIKLHYLSFSLQTSLEFGTLRSLV